MMDHSIKTIQNTIIFVFNVTRFLAFYNVDKIKFYFCDYTSNILSDYKTFVKVNPPNSNVKEDEEPTHNTEENHETQVGVSEVN